MDSIFSFSHEILSILDLVAAILPWDLRTLDLRKDGAGSWIFGILSWDLAGLRGIMVWQQ